MEVKQKEKDLPVINSFSKKYRFLSNFYPCLILYENIRYRSVEHAYQAAKTLSTKERFIISALQSASEAKAYGKKVRLQDGWENIKVQVMADLLMLKFKDSTLRKQLFETGEAILVEGNTWGDTFWGVCDGEGENTLGKLLMALRTVLRDR